jgi:hypothetical protein
VATDTKEFKVYRPKCGDKVKYNGMQYTVQKQRGKNHCTIARSPADPIYHGAIWANGEDAGRLYLTRIPMSELTLLSEARPPKPTPITAPMAAMYRKFCNTEFGYDRTATYIEAKGRLKTSRRYKWYLIGPTHLECLTIVAGQLKLRYDTPKSHYGSEGFAVYIPYLPCPTWHDSDTWRDLCAACAAEPDSILNRQKAADYLFEVGDDRELLIRSDCETWAAATRNMRLS